MDNILSYLESQESVVRKKVLSARERGNKPMEAYWLGKLAVIVEMQNIWEKPVHLKFEN